MGVRVIRRKDGKSDQQDCRLRKSKDREAITNVIRRHPGEPGHLPLST